MQERPVFQSCGVRAADAATLRGSLFAFFRYFRMTFFIDQAVVAVTGIESMRALAPISMVSTTEAPRHQIVHALLDLLVGRLTLGLIHAGVSDAQQLVDPVIHDTGAVAALAQHCRVEHGVEDDAGIRAGAGPREDVDINVAVVAGGDVRAPLRDLDLSIDADLGQLGLEDGSNIDTLLLLVHPDGGAQAVGITGGSQSGLGPSDYKDAA